jgi:hypothetical protein
MTRLTIWTFAGADAAAAAARGLDAEGGRRWTVQERALLRWPEGAAEPITEYDEPAEHVPTSGWRAFWGNLLGMTLAAPLAGAAGGLAWSGSIEAATDEALEEEEAKAVGARLRPGTSALMLVTDGDDPAADGTRQPGWTATLVSRDLTDSLVEQDEF